MLAGKNPLQPHQEEFVKWVYDTVPNNDNWRVWLTRHYKNKPEDFTPEIKSKIQHYSAMMRVSPEIEKVRFDKTHDLHTGLSMLEEAERQFQIKNAKEEGKVYPTPTTKFFNKSATPNRAWFHLGVSSDRGEADAMGHCATCQSKDARLLSLRDVIEENGITFHIPRVTASVYEFPDGSFYIGQMKGPQNKKPDPDYHKDIMELLKNPKMIGLFGLEYNPEEDFKFEELTPAQQKEVLKHNPYFIPNEEAKEAQGKKAAQDVQKNISKIKDLMQGHWHLFKGYILDILKNHPNLFDDPEVVQKLYDSGLTDILINHQDVFIKAPDLIKKLANESDSFRQQIAAHPNLFIQAPYLAEKLANDKVWPVRAEIARNPNLLKHALHLAEKLASDIDKNIRRRIANQPDLFKYPQVFEKLANDADDRVRLEIAKHPSIFTQPYIIEKLADDKNSDIRVRIFSNRHRQLVFWGEFKRARQPIFPLNIFLPLRAKHAGQKRAFSHLCLVKIYLLLLYL